MNELNNLHKNILIVDDEPDICSTFSDYFSNCGYTVMKAETGEEAIDIVSHNDINLAIVDMKMPNIDGLEVLKKVKELKDDTIVIVLTAQGGLKTARTAIQMGAFDYITKPFNFKFIHNVIEDALKQKKNHKN